VQDTGDGNKREFVAMSWANDITGLGSIYSLPPNSCYQLVADRSASNTVIPECSVRYGWVFRNPTQHFWLPASVDIATFKIYLGDEELTECDTEAGQCNFVLP
ncbi:MAG TPA: hypothetical protein VJZ27_15120, partial [Aggregatilineales bacterium]|nr:hypothetical protein [Aggregatilineales bacterium]